MANDDTEKRRHPRYEIPLEGTLHVRDEAVPCRVRNISANGALVEAEVPLRSTNLVTVDIPEIGTMKGRVVRVIWKFAGVALEEGQGEAEAFIVEWLAQESKDGTAP